MRILLNDFSGHPFPLQLSRELAARGHTVLHTWCASFLTPHGAIDRLPEDPANFTIRAIRLDREFNKYGLVSRWRQERAIGDQYVALVGEFQPEVVLSANTPLGAQGKLLRCARARRLPFVFWLQDLYGEGATRVLRKRIPVLGGALGRGFGWYERRLLAHSSEVVAISEDFLPYLPPAVRQRHATVIENWAPIQSLPVLARGNAWSREHGLTEKTCLLYAGTLGMKHNPDLLVALARNFANDDRVRVVVISEGTGAQYLERQKTLLGLRNLLLLPFQPFAVMPQVLASADVLLAILEPDAGRFAVPSKVLTCLCARRPLLLAVPEANLAARIVSNCGAGLVVPPVDTGAFVAAADKLVQDVALRCRCADCGRAYAEQTFDIGRIADRFEAVLKSVAGV